MGLKSHVWIGIVVLIALDLEVNSLDFENTFLPDVKGKISSQCYKDMLNENNIKHFNIKAISAWNTASPGFIYGAQDYTGDYKTCLETLRHDPKMTSPQYCVFDILVTYGRSCDLKLPICSHNNKTDSIIVTPKWTLCAPKSCSQFDLLQLVDVMLKKSPIGKAGLSFEVSLGDNACQTAERKILSFHTIAFLCLTGTLMILVVACTLYHWFRAKKDSKVEVSPLILSWSLIENMPSLFSVNSAEIMVLHRVRVLVAFVVVIIHQPIFFLMAPSNNVDDFKWLLNLDRYIRFDMTIDVFFAMAGFLLAVNFSPRLTSELTSSGNKNLIKLVIKRYIRLGPSMAMVIFFVVSSAQYMTTGPYWPGIVGSEQQMCRKHWLSTLLLVANYGKWSECCWIPTWYIPIDFHCFVLGICFAGVIKRNKTRGVAIIISIILGFIFITGCQIYYNNWDVHPPYSTDIKRHYREMIYFEHTYIKTHMRLPVYFIGLLFGYIASIKRTNKEFISKNTARTGYKLALAIMVFALSIGSILYDPNINPLILAVYGSMSRPFLGLGVSLLFMVWTLQSNDSKVSSADRYFWMPLSKLTFSMNLIHLAFLMSTAGSRQEPYYFNIFELGYLAMGDYMKSIIPSLFLYLFVEIPCARLTNIILKEKRKPAQKAKEG